MTLKNFDMTQEEKPQSIEIPFGAFDSEFIKDEYYIPEGCEVRIEGNKVIIEKIQEEELTEFESKLADLLVYNHPMDIESANSIAKRKSKALLDLARKEICLTCKEYSRGYQEGLKLGREDALQDLPKWKKATEHKDVIDVKKPVVVIVDDKVLLSSYIEKDDYYIELDNLKTLPKEE